MFEKNNSQAFSVIGLMIVVTIIAALSASVYYLINPDKRIFDAKNAVRVQDVESIERAIKATLLDATSTQVLSLTNVTSDTYYSLVSDGGTIGTYTCSELGEDIAGLDIASTVEPFLGSSLPIDPDISSGDDTGYYLVRRGNLFDVGYCNWSREPICGDGYCTSAESCSTCESDCGSCVTPPVEPEPDGRSPYNTEPDVATTANLTWTAWEHPTGGTVEYYVELHLNSLLCNRPTPTTFDWSTNTYVDPTLSLFRNYSWRVKARTQGENDDTDWNTCYSFDTGSFEL